MNHQKKKGLKAVEQIRPSRSYLSPWVPPGGATTRTCPQSGGFLRSQPKAEGLVHLVMTIWEWGGIRSACTSWAAVQTKAPGWVCDHFRAGMNIVSPSHLGALGHFSPLLPACGDVFLSNQREKGLEKGRGPACVVGAEGQGGVSLAQQLLNKNKTQHNTVTSHLSTNDLS